MSWLQMDLRRCYEAAHLVLVFGVSVWPSGTWRHNTLTWSNIRSILNDSMHVVRMMMVMMIMVIITMMMMLMMMMTIDDDGDDDDDDDDGDGDDGDDDDDE